MKFRENVLLVRYSNYKIGGPARFFFEAKKPAEVKAAVAHAKKEKLPVFVLGAATNLLIRDTGFAGLVLKPNIALLAAKGTTITAGAGVMMADLLEFAAKKGLRGLEWAGGLPGTVGGAVRGNAGCFGGETKDAIVAVRSFDVTTMRFRTRRNKGCKFGYRTSIFKKRGGKEIVLTATFKLERGDKKAIRRAIEEKIAYRIMRHPLDYPNIGSIFKNVSLSKFPKRLHKKLLVKSDPFPVVPAAHLVGRAGLKGVSYGGAMVSPKHANFIVNVLDATADDIASLIALVKHEVYKKFKVRLKEEIELL